jgi:hypothetical protein
MRVGNVLGVRQRLQLLDMVSPGKGSPQLEGFKLGLVLRPRGTNAD